MTTSVEYDIANIVDYRTILSADRPSMIELVDDVYKLLPEVATFYRQKYTSPEGKLVIKSSVCGTDIEQCPVVDETGSETGERIAFASGGYYVGFDFAEALQGRGVFYTRYSGGGYARQLVQPFDPAFAKPDLLEATIEYFSAILGIDEEPAEDAPTPELEKSPGKLRTLARAVLARFTVPQANVEASPPAEDAQIAATVETVAPPRSEYGC